MKKAAIYKREILKRTKFKQWRYKEAQEVIIFFDGVYYCYETEASQLKNERLKIPFKKIFESQSTKKLEEYKNLLGRKESDLFIKKIIEEKILNQ